MDEHSEQARRMATVIIAKALLYEAAWSRWSNPSTSLELDEVSRLLEKDVAHQVLLDAVRQLRITR